MPIVNPILLWLRSNRILALILVAALVLHLVSAVGVYLLRPEAISTTPDPLDYRLAALNILHHGVFSLAPAELDAPEMLRTPMYSFLLAGTYLLDGETGFIMILLQSVMIVVCGWLLYLVLHAFRVQEAIALVLTALYLFEPLQWLYTLHTMTETLASLLVLLLLVGALVGKGIRDLPSAALYGVGLGLLVFQKPSAMVWLPFLAILIFAAAGTWKARTARLLVAILLCVMTLLPWMIRNHDLTGHWTLSSTAVFNFILFAGTPDIVPPAFDVPLAIVSYNGHSNNVWYAYTTDAYPMLLETKRAVLAEADLVSLAIRQIAYAPNVWFGFRELQNQQSYGHSYSLIADLALPPDEMRSRIINAADLSLWSVLLVFTAFGSALLVLGSRTRWIFLPLIAILLITVFVNFCLAWTRVLLPLYPIIFVATGVGATYLYERAAERKALF